MLHFNTFKPPQNYTILKRYHLLLFFDFSSYSRIHCHVQLIKSVCPLEEKKDHFASKVLKGRSSFQINCPSIRIFVFYSSKFWSNRKLTGVLMMEERQPLLMDSGDNSIYKQTTHIRLLAILTRKRFAFHLFFFSPVSFSRINILIWLVKVRNELRWRKNSANKNCNWWIILFLF